MNEVRDHTWTDLEAIFDIKEDQHRRERMQRAAKGVK